MSNSKPGLTPEQHAEIGQALSRINRELTELTLRVAGAYPQGSVQARKLHVTSRTLSEARSALDSAMAREHPTEFRPAVYYPPHAHGRWTPSTDSVTSCGDQMVIRLVDDVGDCAASAVIDRADVWLACELLTAAAGAPQATESVVDEATRILREDMP